MSGWFSQNRARNLLALLVLLAVAAFLAFGPTQTVLDKATRYLITRKDVILSEHTAISVFGMAVVLGLEVVFLGWRQSSLYRLLHPTHSTVVDIVCYLLALCGLSGVGILIFSLGLADLVIKLVDPWLPHGLLAVKNPLLQLVWFLVAVDFVKYWIHFLQHKWKAWWELHKFHHAAEEFNAITTARDHPTDDATLAVALLIPLALLGGTADQFLLLSVLLAMHSGLTHSMLPWNFGWLGRWVLVSPITHRIHHSDLPEQFDKNFGMIFIIWDRIFGTYYDGNLINPTVNVADNHYNRHNIVWDYLECPKRFLLALVGRKPAVPPAE